MPSDPPADNSKLVSAKFASRPYAASDDAARSTDSSVGDADSFDGFDTESDTESLMPNSDATAIDTDSEVDLSDEEQAVDEDVPCDGLGSNPDLGSLLQALSKLTPSEAGKMRMFLDDHLAYQEDVGEFPAVSPAPHDGARPIPQPRSQTDLSECSTATSARPRRRMRVRRRIK